MTPNRMIIVFLVLLIFSAPYTIYFAVSSADKVVEKSVLERDCKAMLRDLIELEKAAEHDAAALYLDNLWEKNCKVVPRERR